MLGLLNLVIAAYSEFYLVVQHRAPPPPAAYCLSTQFKIHFGFHALNCRSPSLVLSYRAVAGNPDSALPDLTVNGQSVWQFEDPVHGLQYMLQWC
jgi:hypothetical protein